MITSSLVHHIENFKAVDLVACIFSFCCALRDCRYAPFEKRLIGLEGYMVRTTRNWALPLSIWAYASLTLSRENFSIIVRTPVSSAKRRVSSESVGMPDAQPWIRLLPWIISPVEAWTGSPLAPIT